MAQVKHAAGTVVTVQGSQVTIAQFVSRRGPLNCMVYNAKKSSGGLCQVITDNNGSRPRFL